MRVSVMSGMVLVFAACVAFAQTPQTYRPRKSANLETKTPHKAAPIEKVPNTTAEASKELRRIEQQSAKPLPMKTAGPKAGAGSAAAFKPEKTKPTPPITANVPGGMGTNTKGLGMTNQGKNPYKGRLRQKGTKQ